VPFRRWIVLLVISCGVGLSGVAYDCCKEFGMGCGIGGSSSGGEGGGGGGGGGTPVSAPTPDLNADQPAWGLYTGPVPEHIQQATGATTWPEVLAWVEEQLASGAASANFAGDVIATITEDGEVQSVEIVEREHPEDPPATPGSAPNEGGP
jgi:hypothetical protein